MKSLKTVFAAALVAALSSGAAYAAPIHVSNAQVTIWNFTNPGGQIGDPGEQALPTAVTVAGDWDYQGSYTGNINFYLAGGASNTIGAFIATSGGTFSAPVSDAVKGLQLSSGNFGITTLFNFVFTLTAETIGTIQHDDGISIWNANNTVELVDSAWPTASIPTAFDLQVGTYSLWYSAANSLPEQLVMNGRTVPEPATLALLGLGLLGIGAIRRRKTA